MAKKIKLPLTEDMITELKAGDDVLLSGVLYAARDAAHKRMVEALERGEPLPFDIKGQTIYYTGPASAQPDPPPAAGWMLILPACSSGDSRE